ncbi:MAG: ABC transporter permease, partial [bacterium]
MTTSRGAKIVLTVFAVIAFLFVYIPIAVVLINSFNAGETLSWPPEGFSVQWWEKAVDNEGVREALVTSVILGICATAIALVLGTLAALALGRFRFFGRDSVSLLIILPIALPGIVTGIALNNVFTTFLGGLTFLTLIVAHSTFCFVVVYNNALARVRR